MTDFKRDNLAKIAVFDRLYFAKATGSFPAQAIFRELHSHIVEIIPALLASRGDLGRLIET